MKAPVDGPVTESHRFLLHLESYLIHLIVANVHTFASIIKISNRPLAFRTKPLTV
jgi:hypothetical protein